MPHNNFSETLSFAFSLEALPSAVKTGAPSIQTPIRPGSSLGGIATFVQKSAPRHCTDTTNRYKKSAVNTPNFKTFFKFHPLTLNMIWEIMWGMFESAMFWRLNNNWFHWFHWFLAPQHLRVIRRHILHGQLEDFKVQITLPPARCHGQLPIFHPRKVITHIEKGSNTATATWKTKLFSAKQCGNCQLKNVLYSVSQGVSTMIKL